MSDDPSDDTVGSAIKQRLKYYLCRITIGDCSTPDWKREDETSRSKSDKADGYRIRSGSDGSTVPVGPSHFDAHIPDLDTEDYEDGYIPPRFRLQLTIEECPLVDSGSYNPPEVNHCPSCGAKAEPTDTATMFRCTNSGEIFYVEV